MKILWFTNTPSLYDQGKHHYHGAGWIESLEELLSNEPSIELAVSFFHKTDSQKRNKEKTTYYPILRKSARKNPFKYLINNWQGNVDNPNYIKQSLEIVDDFKPDIIHVFGTEEIFATIQEHTNVPVVIHLQGLINPCVNAYFPPNFSKWNFILDSNYFLDNLLGRSPVFNYKIFVNQAKREVRYLKNAKYLMGRTEWDKATTKLYNQSVTYFHVDEVLRSVFYEPYIKTDNQKNQITIISTISPTIYKGIDLVLKTAHLLTNETDVKFDWKLIGLKSEDKLLKHYEKKLNIEHRSVNIECVGRKTSEELVYILKNCNLFVHPSYIDNSPNSVCEAQILGVPVIACHIGGIPSIIEDNVTGVLIPSNGIYELVTCILEYIVDPGKFELLLENAMQTAKKRHDKNKILKDVIFTYKEILK